ncbi:Beta-1,2-xylosyltransferase 1 [Paramyrothecium foliicola]|nr:Beta-1,2-xylosyltransferase 1 [Paramyrothecium foliicola]
MRRRQTTLIAAITFICICVYSLLRISGDRTTTVTTPNAPKSNDRPKPESPPTWEEQPVVKGGPRPKQPSSTSSHPIQYLLQDASKEFDDLKSRQSKTLDAAVKEYRRRYGIPPPPHFDKWFDFAKRNKIQLIDEFDTIHDLITPFWGLKPGTIRARAKEALGFDNALIGVAIRDHKVSHMAGGADWQQNATQGMMDKFIQYLPDMDLAFNIHDEPRVVVPHEDLVRLVQKAKTVTMPAANEAHSLINDFTPDAPELARGRIFEEVKRTRFNVFAHQATWTHSRMSCPPDSPARTIEDDEGADDLSRYALSDLGFVYNTTALSDICLTPSLKSTYGFFDRPNAYNIVHDLFPIFSQSKISSYSDIIYPSPWYWGEQVTYDGAKDMQWAEKKDKLYWRGSTTGGFSRDGGWRRQHRQNFVQKINSGKQAKIMVNRGLEDAPKWEVAEVPRGEHRDLIDINFSHVGQCDPGDCEAQIQFFNVKDRVEQQDAWAYKYLLDIDGNAFSGRFYAFLQSRSLTFKLAVFREWHFEWLKPWLHYIPLSLQGDDWLEAVRFFSDKTAGAAEAEKIASASREWANKVVRKEDMEAWFFRLLLEYARVIDENRGAIGFDPGSASKKMPPPKGEDAV